MKNSKHSYVLLCMCPSSSQLRKCVLLLLQQQDTSVIANDSFQSIEARDEDREGIKKELEDLEDLNHLDHDQLSQVKSKMDVIFEKNRKRKSDKDFRYDIQQEFNPTEPNDWDDDWATS